MNKVSIEKSMKECLLEAFKNNAIITSDGLSNNEFIHVCNHKAYYEDGGCLGTFSETNELLNSQDWTHNHRWYVIGYLTEDEIKAIKDMAKHEVDLLSLDGEDDYGIITRKVSIPTLDIYRKNKKLIKGHIDNAFFLATPDSTPSGCDSGCVQCVDSDGGVSYSWYNRCDGVRPFFILKSSIFESLEG